MNPTDGRRSAGLDQLRGIAIALVLLRHALPGTFHGAGVVGVVMFFSISGYLITGVLIRDLARYQRIRFGRFYARRAWRLVPALVLVVMVVAIVTVIADPLGDRDELVRTVIVALTWTADLPFDHGSDATFHLWTLAVEEQFYLIWPTALLVLIARRRAGMGFAVVAVVCLVSCLATTWWLHEDPDLAYTLPTSWAICFVIGGAARWWSAPLSAVFNGDSRFAMRTSLTVLALALIGVLSVLPIRGHAATYLLIGPGVALATAFLALRWQDRGMPLPLVPSVLTSLGAISYGAYLWNYPLTIWLRSIEVPGGPAIATVGTLVAAMLSWRLIERPILSWRDAREGRS